MNETLPMTSSRWFVRYQRAERYSGARMRRPWVVVRVDARGALCEYLRAKGGGIRHFSEAGATRAAAELNAGRAADVPDAIANGWGCCEKEA